MSEDVSAICSVKEVAKTIQMNLHNPLGLSVQEMAIKN